LVRRQRAIAAADESLDELVEDYAEAAVVERWPDAEDAITSYNGPPGMVERFTHRTFSRRHMTGFLGGWPVSQPNGRLRSANRDRP
jgi:hypothetical protein